MDSQLTHIVDEWWYLDDYPQETDELVVGSLISLHFNVDVEEGFRGRNTNPRRDMKIRSLSSWKIGDIITIYITRAWNLQKRDC